MAIKQQEFAQLYPDAYREYLDAETGRKHLAAYPAQRQEAQRNLEGILAARARGEDITDAVLVKLLPYADTANNRAAGAWISITPAVNGNLKLWYERARRTRKDAVTRPNLGGVT